MREERIRERKDKERRENEGTGEGRRGERMKGEKRKGEERRELSDLRWESAAEPLSESMSQQTAVGDGQAGTLMSRSAGAGGSVVSCNRAV